MECAGHQCGECNSRLNSLPSPPPCMIHVYFCTILSLTQEGPVERETWGQDKSRVQKLKYMWLQWRKGLAKTWSPPPGLAQEKTRMALFEGVWAFQVRQMSAGGQPGSVGWGHVRLVAEWRRPFNLGNKYLFVLPDPWVSVGTTTHHPRATREISVPRQGWGMEPVLPPGN